MNDSKQLIDSSGNVRLGIFSRPVEEINFRDFELTNPLGRRSGKLKRYFGFNQFQFLGLVSEKLLFGCAIANIKYLATAFVYIYEPATGGLNEYSFKSPLAVGARFDEKPENGTASFRSGKNRIVITGSTNPRQRRLVVELSQGVSMDAVFSEEHPAMQPMRICTRAGATGWVFARKTAGMQVSGQLEWQGQACDLGAIEAYGHHDWSAGYMRRHTFWNWGCLAGRAADGRIVGMNVSCGVNETSFTENCFWVDGALHKLDTVHFDYDRRDLNKPWQLSSFDGRLKLEFRPEGKHQERIDALILASNFNQLFGRYHGHLKTPSGEVLEISGLLGFAESHYAKW